MDPTVLAMLTDDSARNAAVQAALPRIQPGQTLGFGSGRAVFALIWALGESDLDISQMSAVVASPTTAEFAAEVGFAVVDLDSVAGVDQVFDGADEFDTHLGMIKGGGIAVLHEKLLAEAGAKVVILAQAQKQVERLGDTHRLPVEILRYGWTRTRKRIETLTPEVTVRRHAAGQHVITPDGNYLLDVAVPEGNLRDLSSALKATLGVVEHGLFLDEADEILIGHADGRCTTIQRTEQTG